jgi:hypothetical protein
MHLCLSVAILACLRMPASLAQVPNSGLWYKQAKASIKVMPVLTFSARLHVGTIAFSVQLPPQQALFLAGTLPAAYCVLVAQSAIIDLPLPPMHAVDYMNERKTFSPEEISSMVLMKMKETAQAVVGSTPITQAVITCPGACSCTAGSPATHWNSVWCRQSRPQFVASPQHCNRTDCPRPNARYAGGHCAPNDGHMCDEV